MDPLRKERLLADINARVPPGIDWKKGAQDYLSQLIRDQGAHNEFYHLIKPFIGGDDFRPFLDEMYRLLNIMSLANLTGRSRVLDVGCGPGWVSHYLGKLGITVVGIDISQELLDIAARRIATDPFPAMGQFRVKFLLHDIESQPLEGEEPFDLAIFESVLHHFHDPVAVLENVGRVLAADALVVIAEAIAPEPGSAADEGYLSIMKAYHTLERPYTREQLIAMLELTGFTHYQFFEAVNGWLPRTAQEAARVSSQLQQPSGTNFVVASRSAARIAALSGPSATPPAAASPQMSPVTSSSLAEMLALPQDRFVAEAYRALLGRSPDADGAAHYECALAQGRLSRVEVLGRLAYSREGRMREHNFPGLAAAFAFASVRRLPVLGVAAAWLARALRLPT